MFSRVGVYKRLNSACVAPSLYGCVPRFDKGGFIDVYERVVHGGIL
jgi:hypothetical protein